MIPNKGLAQSRKRVSLRLGRKPQQRDQPVNTSSLCPRTEAGTRALSPQNLTRGIDDTPWEKPGALMKPSHPPLHRGTRPREGRALPRSHGGTLQSSPSAWPPRVLGHRAGGLVSDSGTAREWPPGAPRKQTGLTETICMPVCHLPLRIQQTRYLISKLMKTL